MAYITPVTNRTAASYWNVADWERVYNNSRLAHYLFDAVEGAGFSFTPLTAPTITTIPAVSDFNTFLANIEQLRSEVWDLFSVPGTGTEIKDDYEAGTNAESPDYVDANLWESTIDAIWDYLGGPDLDECPTLGSNLTVATGINHVVVDCLNMANFNIDLQGTADLYII